MCLRAVNRSLVACFLRLTGPREALCTTMHTKKNRHYRSHSQALKVKQIKLNWIKSDLVEKMVDRIKENQSEGDGALDALGHAT